MSEYVLLAQLFVLTPVCHFLLNHPRLNRQSRTRGLLYAALFLLASAVLITLLTLQTCAPSYYSVLSVPTTASAADIRRAYKAAAVRLHPDKNPSSPTAAAEFALLARAYEVLEKPELRSLYDKYGAAASDYALSHPSPGPFVQQAVLDTGLWYVMWLGLTYILCLSRDSVLGRNGAWVLLFLTGAGEYQLLYSAWSPLSALLPFTPAHVKVHFLRSLYPSLMNAARLLSQFVFVDHDAIHRRLMQDILTSNILILNTTRQLQAALERGGTPGALLVGEGKEEVDDGSGTGALATNLRLRNEESRMMRMQQQLADSRQKGQGGLPTWLIPVGLFLAFNYFGRGSTDTARA